MTLQVVLRPLRPGELSEPRADDAEFDDFGPQAGYASPPPSRLDDDGALAVVADGQVAGVVSWHWQQWGPNRSSRCPMIGIRLEADARGRGIGTVAQRMLVDLLFRHLSTNRVEAHTDVENVAEQRALAKAGFNHEGTTRGAQWRDGAYRDGMMFSILRAEWAAPH
jgi:RimJ/RimL family protein N-acetyltransferase